MKSYIQIGPSDTKEIIVMKFNQNVQAIIKEMIELKKEIESLNKQIEKLKQ